MFYSWNFKLFKEDQMLSKLAEEVFGVKKNNKKKFNITPIVTNMMVSLFNGIIYTQMKKYSLFYKVENSLVKYLLWRLEGSHKSVRVHFDMNLKGIEGFVKIKVKKYDPLGKFKGYIRTDDIDYLMEICEYVMTLKANRFKRINFTKGLTPRYKWDCDS